ncbi:MAG TPA: DUF2252 family protein [Candidatus Sulfotelmatobacter sp.]|nr:DUF2252 family protein [Candidatus Sulfotelmatobacter sp.]
MNILKATTSFEAWLRARIPVVGADLKQKHEVMAEDEFRFFRGTFYRWAQLWPKLCPDLASAPAVLAVGDLHVNSFGTWRDKIGRLVWGIDDFDEAYSLPYTNDLVRLATSARLAYSLDHLQTTSKDACDAILEGYTDSLKAGGTPLVLEDKNAWFTSIALSRLDDPPSFWRGLESNSALRHPVPATPRKLWKTLFPGHNLRYRVVKRTAGTGSLGHPRFVAIADWEGGKIALEAKLLVQSACNWADQDENKSAIYYQRIMQDAVRCRDPYVRARDNWRISRLAPDSSPVDIETLPKKRDEDRMLNAMGWEAANIHLGSKRSVRFIQRDLRKRRGNWLRSAAKEMAQVVSRDWKEWRAQKM